MNHANALRTASTFESADNPKSSSVYSSARRFARGPPRLQQDIEPEEFGNGPDVVISDASEYRIPANINLGDSNADWTMDGISRVEGLSVLNHDETKQLKGSLHKPISVLPEEGNSRGMFSCTVLTENAATNLACSCRECPSYAAAQNFLA